MESYAVAMVRTTFVI